MYQLGDEIKSSCQIICFVNDQPKEGILNEMMWAHYADNHRGVCLEIDTDKFIGENKEPLIGVHMGLFIPYSYRPSIDNLVDEQQTNVYDLVYQFSRIEA